MAKLHIKKGDTVMILADEERLEEKQNHNLLSGDKYTIIPSKNLSLSVFTD